MFESNGHPMDGMEGGRKRREQFPGTDTMTLGGVAQLTAFKALHYGNSVLRPCGQRKG